ncbi:MAG: hypothetical protein ACREM9_05815, partial [Gemmatimonadales bacterium]
CGARRDPTGKAQRRPRRNGPACFPLSLIGMTPRIQPSGVEMQSYRNLAGNAGVKAYETGTDFIRVQFSSGETYLYTYESAGAANIERMKELAAGGKGLSTFISRTVKGLFAGRVSP